MAVIPAGYVPLSNSGRQARPGARLVAQADPAEPISISIRVRRRPGAPALPIGAERGRGVLSRSEFAQRFGADEADLERVAAFARSHGLTVTGLSAARRIVALAGTVEQVSRAFGVELGHYETRQERYRGRTGAVHVPADLAGLIEGVFGLDNRRMARRAGDSGRATTPAEAAASPSQNTTALTPPQVASLYNFPAVDTSGQSIGLIEFGGPSGTEPPAGYTASDITAYFAGLGLPAPTLTPVGVDGAGNSPSGNPASPDTEVTLDIDVAGSVAPGARIAVYFAPWTEQGWVDVITTAVHDAANAPSVLSISWAWGEFETFGFDWSAAAMDAVSQTFQEAAALGVTVFAASGDDGSNCQVGDGKAHVYYPASDPWVTCCGGTTISNVSGSSFTESTWTRTGGGISDHFGKPMWQTWAGVPGGVNNGRVGRGIPDVAGNADPASGYQLIVGGQSVGPVGGTSATAPLYAGLVARLNADLGEPVGYLNPNLYMLQQGYAFRDINDGASNAVGGAPGYASGPGWDACTGWGSIDGTALLTSLRGVGLPPALHAYGGRLYMAWKGMERDDTIWWSTFDGTKWAPQQRVPGVSTSSGVSLASFNGRLYMAWKGSATGNVPFDERIWWTTFDGTAWAPQQVVPNVWTSVGPRLAVFDGRLYLAWKGEYTDQRIWWTSFDGTSWAPQQRIPGVSTSVGPALAVFNGLLYAAWKGMEGDQGIWWSSFDGTSWAPQRQIPGVSSTEGPSLALFNGLLYASWKGMYGDQGIWWSSFDGTSWAPQQRITGVSTSVGPGLAVFNNTLYASWKGMYGDQRIWWSGFNGTNWAPQQTGPGSTSPDL